MTPLVLPRRGLPALLAAGILVFSGLAAAQPAPATSASAPVPVAPTVPGPRVRTATQGEVVSVVEAPAPVETEWYGATPLLIDGAALTAMTVLGVTAPSARGSGVRSLAWLLSIGTYLAAGPSIHARQPAPDRTRFVASLLLRAGGPFGGALLGCFVNAKSDGEHGIVCGSPGLAIGGLVAGTIGAVLIDDLALARRTVPATGARLVPSLVVSREATVVGLGGAW